ncbi:MAG: chemotaxis protein CheW [Bacillota bacterium]
MKEIKKVNINPFSAGQLSEEVERRILKQRASELAKEAEKEKAAAESLDILLFHLAGEQYGFETRFIKEVINLKDLTSLPLVPSFVKGVINVRGEIISVLDLKVFFELPASGITDMNKVILLHQSDMIFGILADRIAGVIQIPTEELHTGLTTLKGIREEYLKGINSGIIVLDAEKILNDKKIIVYEEV